jgi:hypothetical protein
MTLRRLLVAGVLSVCAPSLGYAEPDAEANVRAGVEYDDNALRVEGDDTVADGLARYFADLSLADRFGSASAFRAHLAHGGKFYFEEIGADALVTQLSASAATRWLSWVSTTLGANVKDRVERGDPEGRVAKRDYDRGAVHGGVALRWGPLRLSPRVEWRWFVFKPDAASSSTGPGARLSATWVAHETFAVSATWTDVRRTFESKALTLEDERPVRGLDAREDRFRVGALSLTYRGPVVAETSYSYSFNDSNSYGQGLARHSASLALTSRLPWQFFISAQGELQTTTYDDPVFIDASLTVDEDNRNALTISLARSFEDWELELRYGLFRQEFGVGGVYRRQTFMVGAGYTFE